VNRVPKRPKSHKPFRKWALLFNKTTGDGLGDLFSGYAEFAYSTRDLIDQCKCPFGWHSSDAVYQYPPQEEINEYHD
jgi:hypothetical protein